MTPQPTSSRAQPEVGGDWRHRAACRDVDPEIFYPTAEAGQVLDRQVAAAKTVCAGCPVRAECLDFALTHLPDGIAGGLTPAERRTHRARSARQKTSRAGRPVGGTDQEVAAAGRVAIRSGRPVAEVAREFGVSERTAARWAAQVRAEVTGSPVGAGTGRGSGESIDLRPGVRS